MNYLVAPMGKLPIQIRLTLILALFTEPGTVMAQFGIAPTDSLVSVFGVDSITRIFQIDFPNESGDSLGLSWRRVEGGWTEGWDVNLCDLGECYTGVPADADMLPMGPDGTGYLKLIVNALEWEGNCFLHFWVWPTGNQDALVHVYFDLRNDAQVSGFGHITVSDEGPAAYPIPARRGTPVVIPCPAGYGRFQPVQLFDGRGALLPCMITRKEGFLELETGHLSPGMYLLKLNPERPPVRLIME